MALKLCSFLIVCNIMLAVGHLKPGRFSQSHDPINKIENLTTFLPKDDRTFVVDKPKYNNENDGTVNKDKTELEEISTMETRPIEIEDSVIVPESNIIKQCPAGQSTYIRDDLLKLVEYFGNETYLIERINGSYFNFAKSVRDHHAKTLEEFEMLFDNKPVHLKHILQDVEQNRLKEIEPLARKIAVKLQNVNLLYDLYNDKLIDAIMLFNEIETAKQICHWNCGTQKSAIHKRSVDLKVPIEDIYYCSTLEDIKQEVTSTRELYLGKYIEILNITITQVDQDYKKRITDLKSELKEIGVQEFGATMYDILNLQDENNHFLNSLKNKDFNSLLTNIKKNCMDIGFKIEELKENVEKYRDHCTTCNKKLWFRRADVFPTDLVDLQNDFTPDDVTIQTAHGDNILKQLINDFINVLKEKIETDYQNLFEVITDKLGNKQEFIRNALAHLQPIQEEIKEILQKELQESENVRNLVPTTSIDELLKLKADTDILTKNLELALHFITDNM